MGDIDALANQIANYLLTKGLTQKSTVGLMLLNRPEFVAFWLGAAKIGCATSLLNTNLLGATLLHSVKTSLDATSSCKLLVIDDDIEGGIEEDLRALRNSGVTIIS